LSKTTDSSGFPTVELFLACLCLPTQNNPFMKNDGAWPVFYRPVPEFRLEENGMFKELATVFSIAAATAFTCSMGAQLTGNVISNNYTSDQTVKPAMDKAAFGNVKLAGSAFPSCGKNFTATNAVGENIKGRVCAHPVGSTYIAVF
jgi:hypothetical protein